MLIFIKVYQDNKYETKAIRNATNNQTATKFQSNFPLSPIIMTIQRSRIPNASLKFLQTNRTRYLFSTLHFEEAIFSRTCPFTIKHRAADEKAGGTGFGAPAPDVFAKKERSDELRTIVSEKRGKRGYC